MQIHRKLRCVESLQSHFILTMSHWSSGLTLCFLSQGTWVQIPRGVLMWNRNSPVSDVSLLGDPDVIDHHGLVWGGLRPKTITRPSCCQCDNPTWSHTAFLSRFHPHCRSPFRLHKRQMAAGGEPYAEPAISLHFHHVSLVQWTNHLLPITRDLGSNPQGGTFVKQGFSC